MTYDVIVLGSGPGGYSAAVRAGQYGLKTAIIEKDPKLGGTCLHVGCIPATAFLHAADVWQRFLHSTEEGIHCENPRLDFPLVSDRKNKIVSKHAQGVEFLMKKNKVDWIKLWPSGRPGKIEVTSESGKQTYEARNIVVATGSEARMLPGLTADDKRIFTNIEILNLREVPKSLAILGAGAVGVEFASCFHRFGTKVSLFEMLPRIVPVEDEEVSKELERYFKKSGIRVETARARRKRAEDRPRRRFTHDARGRQERWKPRRCSSPSYKPSPRTLSQKAPASRATPASSNRRTTHP
jgi:dihydrolipoamide dehydrogenase